MSVAKPAALPRLSEMRSEPELASRPDLPAEIIRLTALHREAKETADLVDLLGYAPRAAITLAVASGFAAAFSLIEMPNEPTAAWLVLILVGVGMIARAYDRTIHTPFERKALSTFAEDFAGILAYCGFAWGTGAFLILPANTTAPAAVAFAIVLPALIAALLRNREIVLLFLIPATALSAFAIVLRPLPAGPSAATFTLASAVLIAAMVLWHERRTAHPPSISEPAKLPLTSREAL